MLPILTKYAIGKKVSGFQMDGWLKKAVVIVVLLIAISLFFGKKIKAAWSYVFNPDTDTTAGREIIKKNLSFSKTQYKVYSDELEIAMQEHGFGDGTNEDAILKVIGKMQNRDDVLALIIAFGKRKYQNWTGFMSNNYGLSMWFTAELNVSEREKLNQILSSKNINFSF